MPKQSVSWLVVVILAFLFTGLSFAQAGRAEMVGVVRDRPGLEVPGVMVQAEDQATTSRYAAVTDERGEYHILGLPAGQYVVSVERSGFRAYRQSGLILRLGDRTPLDVSLNIGEL